MPTRPNTAGKTFFIKDTWIQLYELYEFSPKDTVIGPISRLTAHATAIGTSSDLTSAINLQRKDEIGTLANEFDDMVKKLSDSQRRLMKLSRDAGMADVAIDVLHNVGNVMNSINVSTSCVAGKIRNSRLSGLSKLADLMHQLPIDVVKIDRTFTATMDSNRDCVAIIQAITTLAHHLRMRVVVEGIETHGQLKRLVALKCSFGQGYLFSEPVAAKAAEQFLVNAGKPQFDPPVSMPQKCMSNAHPDRW